MNAYEKYWNLKHDTFLVFIEITIKGSWRESSQLDLTKKGDFMVSGEKGSEIKISISDSDHRSLFFNLDATVSINQNILSYNSKEVDVKFYDSFV